MSSTPADDLVLALREGLAELADPARAAPMQAYMRSAMPFRGVATPARQRMVRGVVAEHPFADRATWEDVVDALWDGAEFREERYVAVDVCAHRSARAWQDVAIVERYDRMVVTGAWWDHVDAVAIGLIGPILRAEHDALASTVRAWSVDADRWRRRTSIIVQVGARGDVDLELLADVVDANADDRDVFIRKGIGWALRDAARRAPDWVRSFVAERADRLSPLSRREATKHL